MIILYIIIVVVALQELAFHQHYNDDDGCFHYGSKYSNKRDICMKPWVSNWLHGKATFGQLFNEDVQTMNKVKPKFFSVFV